jgi:hypothetical protein
MANTRPFEKRNPPVQPIRPGGQCRHQTPQSVPALSSFLQASASCMRIATLGQRFRIAPGGNRRSPETGRRQEELPTVALHGSLQGRIPTPLSGPYELQGSSCARDIHGAGAQLQCKGRSHHDIAAHTLSKIESHARLPPQILKVLQLRPRASARTGQL